MKILAVILIILALMISIIPQFTDCESQGRMLTLQDGRQIAMKCHWTARAELGSGITLLFLGIGLLISRRKETRIILGSLGVVIGIFIVLLPTTLIGVCLSPEMVCNSTMKPFLILSGSLVIVVCLISIIHAVFNKGTGQDARN